MLDYIQWTIDNKGAIIIQGAGTELIKHWNLVFPYVDYTNADQPPLTLDTAIFIAGTGTAGVITQTTTDRELRTPEAAITVPVQDETGDQQPHLFVIYPKNDGC